MARRKMKVFVTSHFRTGWEYTARQLGRMLAELVPSSSQTVPTTTVVAPHYEFIIREEVRPDNESA